MPLVMPEYSHYLYAFLTQGLVALPSADSTAPQSHVLDRRLEDKIRYLCSLAKVAKDDDAWLLLSELRVLLAQHVEHFRMVAANKLSGAAPFVERRSDSEGQENQPSPETSSRTTLDKGRPPRS
jgi:hypothetical protein